MNTQYYKLFNLTNKFSKNYTILDFGGKYQLYDSLNLEIYYGNFVKKFSADLRQTFNLGLKY
jgi:hypothetical protein